MVEIQYSSTLILPGDFLFEETLHQIPFWWESFAHENSGWCNFGVDSESGLFKPLNKQQTEDYLFGGEFEARLEQMEVEPEDVWFDYSQEELEAVEEFYVDL
jgi:hypothetical protein